MRFLWVLILVACGASQHGDTAKSRKLGAITGLVRDANTSVSLVDVDVEIAGRTVKSRKDGIYELDGLAPGKYTLHSEYAGQPVTINGIDVTPGEATYVDVSFTLGAPSPIVIDWGDRREGEIKHFTATVPRIEGTVADATTRHRVPGAVVTAAGPTDTLQTVTDDHGRYRFDNVPAATYAVSAYYSVGGRGQIEVRRSDIAVKAGEGVFVPLWIELSKQ